MHITTTFDNDLKEHLELFGWTPERTVDISEWRTVLRAEGLTDIPDFIQTLWKELGGLRIPAGDHALRLNRERWRSLGSPVEHLLIDPVAATRDMGCESVMDLIDCATLYGKRLYPFGLHIEGYSTMVLSETGELIDIANSQFDIWGETPNEGLRNWLFFLCYPKS